MASWPKPPLPPTKDTWNLNLVFGFRSQDRWPPVLAFPAKRQYLLLPGLGPLLELGDIGLEDLGEWPRSYPQEWNQSSSRMAADKVLSGVV